MFFWIRLRTSQPILTWFFLNNQEYRRIGAKNSRFQNHPDRKWEIRKTHRFWTLLVAPLCGETTGWISTSSFRNRSTRIPIEPKTIESQIWPSQQPQEDEIWEDFRQSVPVYRLPYAKPMTVKTVILIGYKKMKCWVWITSNAGAAPRKSNTRKHGWSILRNCISFWTDCDCLWIRRPVHQFLTAKKWPFAMHDESGQEKLCWRFWFSNKTRAQDNGLSLVYESINA